MSESWQLSPSRSSHSVTLNLQAVLNLVISESRGLLNAEAVSVLLYDQAAASCTLQPLQPWGGAIDWETDAGQPGIPDWVMQHKQAVLSHDAYADARFSPQIDESNRMTTRSILAVPLMTRSRLGVIEALTRWKCFEAEHLVTLERWPARQRLPPKARLYQMEKEMRRAGRDTA